MQAVISQNLYTTAVSSGERDEKWRNRGSGVLATTTPVDPEQSEAARTEGAVVRMCRYLADECRTKRRR